MRFSPGCGCCNPCVDLDVTAIDQQTSKWDRVDYAGTSTVTILQRVSLCNFSLDMKIGKPERAGSSQEYTSSWEGTLTVLFLESPDDDDADAIGTVEFTNRNAHETSHPFARLGAEPLPFYLDLGAGLPETGEGSVDITDMGISATFKHDGVSLVWESGEDRDYFVMRLQSYDDAFVVTYDPFVDAVEEFAHVNAGLFYSGSETPTGLDTFGTELILNRSSCTDQDVYIRYKTEDDFDLTAYGVIFTLQTLNPVGDISCRTDTAYYTEDPADGDCTDPPEYCEVLTDHQRPWAKVRVQVTDDPFYPDADETMWLIGGGTEDDGTLLPTTIADASNRCKASASRNLSGVPTRFSVSVELKCTSGTPQLWVTYVDDRNGNGALWILELSPSVTHPSGFPTGMTLNEDNSTNYSNQIYTVELTLN